MEMKLELVAVPVTDTDRAKEFYEKKVGFVVDHDHRVQEGLRFVQLTPPGSACSIVIGDGTTTMKAGSQQGLQMVIKDAQKAHDTLKANGVAVSEVQDMPWGIFVFFEDPDGNKLEVCFRESTTASS